MVGGDSDASGSEFSTAIAMRDPDLSATTELERFMDASNLDRRTSVAPNRRWQATVPPLATDLCPEEPRFPHRPKPSGPASTPANSLGWRRVITPSGVGCRPNPARLFDRHPTRSNGEERTRCDHARRNVF